MEVCFESVDLVGEVGQFAQYGVAEGEGCEETGPVVECADGHADEEGGEGMEWGGQIGWWGGDGQEAVGEGDGEGGEGGYLLWVGWDGGEEREG